MMSRRAALRAVQPSLDAGVVLAERFKITRFIARGGMGEVYEALDQELNEPVALKTIRPDIAEDPMALARFKREIQLARKVTHPNVSRMFDIFRHRWPSVPEGEPEDLTFLTMELLAGETLHEKLRRDGPMPPRDALVIVEQVTTALAAAHAAGVSTPFVSLAKKEEEIYLPGRAEPLRLARRSPSLRLLQRARDEAHRVAVTFNRKRRSVRTITSALLDIPGIGPARRRALLAAFGSLAGVKSATVEELKRVDGVSDTVAARIFEALHRDS